MLVFYGFLWTLLRGLDGLLRHQVAYPCSFRPTSTKNLGSYHCLQCSQAILRIVVLPQEHYQKSGRHLKNCPHLGSDGTWAKRQHIFSFQVLTDWPRERERARERQTVEDLRLYTSFFLEAPTRSPRYSIHLPTLTV